MYHALSRQGKNALRLTVALAALLFAAHAAVILTVRDDALRAAFSDLALPLEGLLATGALIFAAHRSAAHSRRVFIAWACLALSRASLTIGDSIWAVLDVGLHAPPFPSLSDAFYLACYPLLLYGIFRMPHTRGAASEHLRVALDITAIMLSAGLLFWDFLLGPLLQQATGTNWLQVGLSLAYPLGDLALLWALLDLIIRRLESRRSGPLVLVAISMAATIVVDSLYGMQSLAGTYAAGKLLDIGFLPDLFLVAIAGVWHGLTVGAPEPLPASSQPAPRRIGAWPSHFSYLWLAALFALLIWRHSHPGTLSFDALAIGLAVAATLTLVRQALSTSESSIFYKRLQAMYADLDERVRVRTADLAVANRDLRAEVGQRKQAEEALQHEEERYRTLFLTAERQRREMELLNEVRSTFARELDLSTILRAVVDAIANTFGYTQVSLYLVAGQELVLQHQVGYDHVLARIPLTQGVAGRVVRTGQAVFYADVHQAPEFLGAIEGIISEVCVPLYGQDQVIGILSVESTGGTVLTESDLRLVASVANQTSIAIGRATLYQEVRASEDALRQAHNELESRVQERTSELAQANRELRQEVAERQRAEEALREKEERWQFALEGSGDGAWDWDMASDTFFWSSRFCEILGLGPDELAPSLEAWRGFVYPEDQARADAAMVAYREGQAPNYAAELRVRTKDGQTRWVLDRAKITAYAPDGTPLRMVGTISDITARREQEDRLRLLNQAIEQADEGVLITDAGGVVQYVNSAFQHMTGFSWAEAVGRRPNFMTVRDPAMLASMNVAIAACESWRGRMRLVRSDKNECLVAWSVTPMLNPEGQCTHWVGILNDVTESQRLEEQFRQAQKMEAVGRLAGGVAHDFNNLLTVINGYSQLLLSDGRVPEDLRSDVRAMLQSGQRAAALTGQLLAFSRQQKLEMRPLDLNDLCRGVADMLQRLIGEHVSLSLHLAEKVWRVVADQGQLEQVLLNLAVNARDAMPDGGTLTIETTNIELQQALSCLPDGVPPGSYAAFVVRDTGLGMSPEVREHIFEPFFTTKAPGKGTGLGLATVYGIVNQSHAHLRVDSAPGTGAAFWIYLPRADEKTPLANGILAVASVSGGREHILVVDDQPPVRQLTGRMLHRLGYKVHEASSAAEALAFLSKLPDGVDLVLTDVAMPEMTGWAFIEKLRQAGYAPRVIFMSGYARDEMQHAEGAAGALFLQKPFTLQSLADCVRQALDR